MSNRVPNSETNVVQFPSSAILRPEIIPFAGGELEALRGGAAGYLSVKAACESLGIDAQAQQRRLERSPWASTAIMAVVAADGKQREMFCVRIEKVGMWLATIETSRIADPVVRAKIELWQCEAADVLDRWFRGAAFVRAAEPVESFGRLEEWERVRKNVDIAGRVLSVVTEDISRLGSGQAALETKLNDLSDYAERLELELHRDKPTAEQRAELVRAIGAACECRASERERLMLVHIAEQGPRTTQVRMAAAAGISSALASIVFGRMQERAVVDREQRDPSMSRIYNYYVVAEGLEGHADDCEIEYKRGAAALAKMLEMTSGEAVHVVPPNIPHIPVPQVSEESGRSARDLLTDFVSKICFDNGLSYKDFYSQLYARLAIEGMECRHRTSKDRPVSKIDYCDAHGWCPRALEIAKTIDIKTVLRNATEQRAG